VTYVLGQRIKLSTSVLDVEGALTDATVVLTVTAPDGTVSTPAVTHPATGWYEAEVTLSQAGDWLRVWSTSGTVVSTDVDQIHVIAPVLRIVGLAEVKEHGNITTTSHDRELLDFIGTAQQMIEDIVGVTVPRTFTETHYATPGGYVWLREAPVMSVTSVDEYGAPVDPSLYIADLNAGAIGRTDGRSWHADSTTALTTVYRAGRAPIPEGIRWAAKELTIALWRSTQAQRGGRARGTDAPEAPTGYALPNRVREALAPFLLVPAVA
jgi:hypothetical protein